MKKITVLVLTLFITYASFAQFPKDRFRNEEVTWFGIDYTKSRMVGASGFNDPHTIVNYLFGAWNNFVITEEGKYNIPKTMRKDDIKIDISLVQERNSTVDPKTIIHQKTRNLNEQDVTEILEAYDFSSKKGLGTMFIVEHYNKLTVRGTYLFLVFDVKTKEVLFVKRYTAEAAGFGLRNYWARTFYTTLKTIGSSMKQWQR